MHNFKIKCFFEKNKNRNYLLPNGNDILPVTFHTHDECSHMDNIMSPPINVTMFAYIKNVVGRM